MSDKFRRGRSGTEKFFKKHKSFRKRRDGDYRQERREHQPSRYDPDARYS